MRNVNLTELAQGIYATHQSTWAQVKSENPGKSSAELHKSFYAKIEGKLGGNFKEVYNNIEAKKILAASPKLKAVLFKFQTDQNLNFDFQLLPTAKEIATDIYNERVDLWKEAGGNIKQFIDLVNDRLKCFGSSLSMLSKDKDAIEIFSKSSVLKPAIQYTKLYDTAKLIVEKKVKNFKDDTPSSQLNFIEGLCKSQNCTFKEIMENDDARAVLEKDSDLKNFIYSQEKQEQEGNIDEFYIEQTLELAKKYANSILEPFTMLKARNLLEANDEQELSETKLKSKIRKIMLQCHPDKIKDPEKKESAEEIYLAASIIRELIEHKNLSLYFKNLQKFRKK